jgi:hypothetical protein
MGRGQIGSDIHWQGQQGRGQEQRHKKRKVQQAMLNDSSQPCIEVYIGRQPAVPLMMRERGHPH